MLGEPLSGEANAILELLFESGAILRREFHRAGGPRGYGGHADVDGEVEEFLRDRLRSAFPHDGFLGEETGSYEGLSGRRWIVDPNDGTSEFLKGYRGASVSIALVEAGQPVLGGVFSYVAPDDDGDLIIGGPGLGLFRGTRSQIEPKAVACSIHQSRPERTATVAISSRAARDQTLLEANAERCRPWQPRPVVGIAYRLALAAAGDVQVATTLTAPWSWDMAGGHALLRGAGADLFTRGGDPVTYDTAGHCTYSPAYFGGPWRLVKVLLERDWETLMVGRPGRRA